MLKRIAVANYCFCCNWNNCSTLCVAKKSFSRKAKLEARASFHFALMSAIIILGDGTTTLMYEAYCLQGYTCTLASNSHCSPMAESKLTDSLSELGCPTCSFANASREA